MPDSRLTEHAVAQYIAEQADEMISLVNFCEPSDRVHFLTYLIDMIRMEAKQLHNELPKPMPFLVCSKAEDSIGSES